YIGTKEAPEELRQVRRDFVAAAPDSRPDGGQDAPRVGLRGVLEGPDAAPGDGEAGTSPTRMNRGGSACLFRIQQDGKAVRDTHADGLSGLQRDQRIRALGLLFARGKDLLAAGSHDAVAV